MAIASCRLAAVSWAAQFSPVADVPFTQEYREEKAYPPGAEARQVRSVAVTDDGDVWLGTKAGVFRLSQGSWRQVLRGSTYSLSAHGADVWAGAWDGLYRIHAGKPEKVAAVEGSVPCVWADRLGVVAATQTVLYEWDGSAWRSSRWSHSKALRSIARDATGGLWLATGMGAYYKQGESVLEIYKEADLLAGELRSVAIANNGDVWLGGIGGLDVYRNGKRAGWHNVSNGMPSQDVRSVAIEPDGTVWAGTPIGAARRKENHWSFRSSRRWLPSDDVVAIAAGPDRTVWIATGAGLSAIHRKNMTLAEKANHYLKICLARHVRAPYLVEQCNLKNQGDTAHFAPRDDDNEGGYTGEYLAMESYRYAVTKDPESRARARKAFQAMKFLQEVTGTRGFFARTAVPAGWTKMADANETITLEERADRLVRDPRDKPLENRWRLSADRKWLWKGDTSSDETSAHFFAYFTYYNLAAHESDRKAIRDLVSRVVDFILEGGYTFRDIDGQPTRWGVWAPEKLNDDADWRAERWLNGLEMLSYLRLAEYLTGDSKYRIARLALIEKHHYDAYARRPLATEPSERTYFDEELAGFVLPLAFTETDFERRKIYEEGLEFWRQRTRDQDNPIFNFTWASLANPHDPNELALNTCVDVLRDEPLDLVQWTVDSRKREDVRIVHQPILDSVEVDRILPPSERGTMRTDSNLYEAVRGEDGMSESSGVFWLLPYWMGRYYGFIGAPK